MNDQKQNGKPKWYRTIILAASALGVLASAVAGTYVTLKSSGILQGDLDRLTHHLAVKHSKFIPTEIIPVKETEKDTIRLRVFETGTVQVVRLFFNKGALYRGGCWIPSEDPHEYLKKIGKLKLVATAKAEEAPIIFPCPGINAMSPYQEEDVGEVKGNDVARLKKWTFKNGCHVLVEINIVTSAIISFQSGCVCPKGK